MDNIIDRVTELLQTAYAEKDWELVLEAIQLLNEIPNENLPCNEDENVYDSDEDE